jgi:hypothetical protein
MKAFLALALLPFVCAAQQPHQEEIQRAIIDLDRRSADFSASHPPASDPLQPHVGRPLHPDPVIARELQPYERMRMAEKQHVLRLPPPVVQQKAAKPLPLPGGPQPGVDPVTPPGLRD